MKFFRYFLYILIAIFLLLTPIYALGRILLPDWIISNVTANLPPGSKLSIGSISSKADLGFEYNNILYEAPSQSFVIKISSLLVKPRLSVNSPLVLSAEDFILSDKNSSITLKNLQSKIVIEDVFKKDLSLSGNLESLSSSQKSTFFDINFILRGLNSEEKLLFLETETVDLNFNTALGPIVLKANDSSYNFTINKGLTIAFKAKETSIDMSQMVNGNEGRILVAEKINGNLELKKEKNWIMPLELNLVKPRAAFGPISSSAILKSEAMWRMNSAECNINEILLLRSHCGQITDFLNLIVSLKSENESINFTGDGYCVTPDSNCLQEIQASIGAKNTVNVISKIISSGIVNPLFGSIILGSLISSPSVDSSSYDHEIKLEIIGSSIKINGKPLI